MLKCSYNTVLRLHIYFFTVLILTAVCLNISEAQNYWVIKDSPTTRNLTEVFFLDSNTGWIAGDSGTIIKTTDNGMSWVQQNTGTFNNIVEIFFLNERTGWALSWGIFPDSLNFLGTIVLSTSDGGNNWSRKNFDEANTYMKSLFFFDSLYGFTGGAPGAIYKTTNGGNRWNVTQIDTTSDVILPVECIKFYDTQIGFASGGFRDLAGCMWKTTNGGQLWSIVIVGPEPLNDLYLINSSRILAIGGDFEYGSSYVNSYDSGNTWFYDTLGIYGVARSLDFRTPSEVWVSVGPNFSVSYDTGNSWTSFPTPDSLRLEDICFTDSLNGWGVGYGGILMQYDRTVSSVSAFSDDYTPESFDLYQNYPNPFNPVTKISYYLSKPQDVRLSVYNSIGEIIADPVNEFKNSGYHSFEFNSGNLSSGVYFYKLSAGGISKIRKMLLVK